MKHKCRYCDYESAYKPNVRRHEHNKHGEPISPQPATSYRQSYPQPQSGQHQQPVYHHNQHKTLADVMDTDQPDFLSESDSEDSDIDLEHKLENIITGIDTSFTNILSLRIQCLQALEK